MHESTVSRVTTNKYVHTPRGIYELKYFFNSAISTFGRESVASESVRDHVKRLIADEDPAAPYSDQQVVELLKQHDINFARRTVAKYRDMLKIPSSTKRKRLFQATGQGWGKATSKRLHSVSNDNGAHHAFLVG
ncbi:hypothetical protein ACFL6C_13815 [Myxococcota bacterium]